VTREHGKPLSSGPRQRELDWALTYDAYQRLADSPSELEQLLRGVRRSFYAEGAVPEWCGIDLLRGWAFYLVRDDHFGATMDEQEWAGVLQALRDHPSASSADRPPRNSDHVGVVLPKSFSEKPKQHRDPAFLAAKRARLREDHVAPINSLVDDIASELSTELGTGVSVPYVDPDSGGVLARCLITLESPAGPAALGSGMLSPDNDDETAKNTWLAYRASAMPRTYGLHWNAVPWYVGTGTRNASVTHEQVRRGQRYLLRLLDLATEVRVVLALGRHAQRSIAASAEELVRRGITIIDAPHPGPIPAGVTHGQSLVEVNAAFSEAMRALKAS